MAYLPTNSGQAVFTPIESTNMRRNSSLCVLVASACSALLVLSGCGSAENDSSHSSATSSDAVISIYGPEPAKPLIPSDTNEIGGGNPIEMMFSRLVRFDSKGKAVNEIAQDIKPNADMTQYTITIKPGWKFTDGSPVTSQSFTKAWSWGANAANAQLGSSSYNIIKGYDALQNPGIDNNAQLEGLKVVDDRTFTVDLVAPSSTFPTVLGYTPYSPLPEVFYKDTKAFGEKPVTAGPYKFVSWEHNKFVKLAKDPNYKGGLTVKNGGLEFRSYSDTTAAYADIQSGNLDVMDFIPTSAFKTFLTDSSIQAKSQAGPIVQYMVIPSAMPHFKEDEEGRLRRQAISLSINRQQLIDKVIGGTATPATDFISPTIPGYSKNLKGSDVLKYDSAKAKELWEKANTINPWDPNASFTVAYNVDGGYKDIYDAITNSIKNTLDIKTEASPIPTFSEFNANLAHRTFTQKGMAFRGGWQPDYPSPEAYLKPKFISSAADGHGANYGDYKNSQADELLQEASSAKSIDASNKKFQEMQEVLLKDLPAIPIYCDNSKGAASKQLHGFEFTWKGTPEYWNLSK